LEVTKEVISDVEDGENNFDDAIYDPLWMPNPTRLGKL